MSEEKENSLKSISSRKSFEEIDFSSSSEKIPTLKRKSVSVSELSKYVDDLPSTPVPNRMLSRNENLMGANMRTKSDGQIRRGVLAKKLSGTGLSASISMTSLLETGNQITLSKSPLSSPNSHSSSPLSSPNSHQRSPTPRTFSSQTSPNQRGLSASTSIEGLTEKGRKPSLTLNKEDVAAELLALNEETLELLDQFDAILKDAITSY